MKRIPQNEIYRILSGLAGTVGLYVEDCQSGEIFTINGACVSLGQPSSRSLCWPFSCRDAQQGLVDLDAPPHHRPPQPGGRDRHPVRAGHRLHPFCGIWPS